jgi:tricorn protease
MEVDSSRVLDRSDYDGLRGIAWSPDGRWLAYGYPYTAQKTAIKLCNLESGETRFVTEPVLQDVSPAFDPEGKYLYFLGYRTFNPVYDNLQFDLSFPRGVKPNAIMLQKDLRSPFIPEARSPEEKEKEKEVNNSEKQEKAVEDTGQQENGDLKKEAKKPTPIVIDLEGITARAVPFPVPEGKFRAVRGIVGKALFLSFPIESVGATRCRMEANVRRGLASAA